MHIFYSPDIENNLYILDEKESRHCIRVLRMSKGTPVRLIDGKGNLYEGVISHPDQKRCIVEIKSVIPDFEKRNYHLHIAISQLKNQERFEWFVEKSVEIGIDEITPLICRNTEKQSVKKDRINNIITSAMKQSVKAYRPVFNDPVPFERFVERELDGTRMIAHCMGNYPRSGIREVYTAGDSAVILIGPEGDFSMDEISIASEHGFKHVHLGNSRLRTETAGVTACCQVAFLNQRSIIP
ncbi:MAG: 16S rRNA (uracil(1498)-N(3))-methyltransferase [Bacteroidales bacterium]|nr:16S rRNA (uracil(1498)-N(3))-methyltransferase [Bacteroidales bacterium]